ncbi:hypothetical protein [Sinorhizobium fredii]|uniref:hypothetical protein n=1 Tax=Rhizobium fredii TaxID=380 RepID=UPI00059D5896|nr:hypothetical protein [Sinorhizobium fredii]
MRILVTTFAVFALAAAPCAWDSDPREPSALAALFASPALQGQRARHPADGRYAGSVCSSRHLRGDFGGLSPVTAADSLLLKGSALNASAP